MSDRALDRDAVDPREEVERLRARVRELENLGPDPAVIAVAESSPDFVTLLDLDGRILYINRVLPPHTQASTIGTLVYDYIPQEFRDRVRATFEAVVRDGEPGWFETEYHDPRGWTSYFSTVVGPVLRDGTVVGFSMIARDVSAHRRVREEQERFFHLSLDMLCIASFEGYFLRCNPAFTRVLGFDEAELLSRPIVSFIHPDDLSRTERAFEMLFAGEAVIDFENRYFRKDGDVRWISWRSTSDASRNEIYAVARDVTERKRLEAQLRQSQKMEAVGQLAGGIAHDFNNFVLAIQANIDFARGVLGPASDIEENLEEIHRATQRAAELTRQVLAFAGSQPPRSVHFDLGRLLHETLQLVRRLLPPGIEVATDIEAPAEPVIRGDPAQIQQVLMNLCLNARDALPAGGRIGFRIAVVEDAEPGGKGSVRLTVEDDGIGMSPEVKEHLFEPFFTTKGPGKGTGLGLATVYGIVRQHGGRIEVTSEPGEGSTFAIELPLARAEGPLELPSLDPSERLGGDETLLVAEDEELVRGVLRRILETAGYRVILAEDGREALSRFRENREEIDLVLLDHLMPGHTGVDVLGAIRGEGSRVPVIISSGFRPRREREGGGPPLEPDGFLEKPFQPPQLLGAVRRLLDERKGAGVS